MQTSLDNRKMQVRRSDQALYPIQSGSFVGRGPWLYATSPCIIIIVRKGERTEGRRREKFYIYSGVTHTPGRSRVNPERQEEAKKRTQTTGKRPKQRRGGGEQTDLRNQPTRRNGPDQNRAHT